MLRKAKNCRALFCVISANALEHRGAIMEGMGHGVDVGLRPFIQFSHVPEFFRPWKMGVVTHDNSFGYNYSKEIFL
jgi:hypothetical protein